MNPSNIFRPLLLLGVVALVPALVSAADVTKPSSPPPAVHASGAAPATATHQLAGNIVSFDAKTNILIVSQTAGNAIVKLDLATVYTFNGKPATRAELVAGRHAEVAARDLDGANHAVSVAVHS